MELRRSLSLFDAYAIGVGAIIGAGIFVVTGAAASMAGPALLLSLLIGAGISAFTAMSFAELAMKIPKEGGGYEFAHELVSPLGGYIAGWMWLLSNILSGAAVAIGFASYLSAFIPLPVNLTAALTCVAITGLNLWGAKESSIVNDLLVIFKVAVLALFVVACFLLIKPSNFAPLAPNGAWGVMQGAALIFFAYSGFGRVAMVSEEVVDPARTIPRAIILALATSTVVYLLVSGTAIGTVGYVALASSSSPLSTAGLEAGAWLSNLIGIAALAATLSVLLTTRLGMSRISFAMARNGDMPSFLTRLYPKTQTPVLAILIFGTVMTLFTLFSSLLFAAALSNFASLVYYALVNLSASRMGAPVYSRAFPILGLATCLLLLAFIGLDAWAFGLAALALTLVLYEVHRRRAGQGKENFTR